MEKFFVEPQILKNLYFWVYQYSMKAYIWQKHTQS